MGTGATMVAAAVMGLGLGSYVTSPQSPPNRASEFVDATIDDQTAADTSLAMQAGPGEIHCTGCGPTLADRRWKADMAGLDAADQDMGSMVEDEGDRAAPDYPAEESMAVAEPEGSSSAIHIPPQVGRLVAGEAPSPPVVAMQTVQTIAPPPTRVATAAGDGQN
jgi:hypothetical protein